MFAESRHLIKCPGLNSGPFDANMCSAIEFSESGFHYRIKAEGGYFLMNVRKVFRFELHVSDTCG